MVQKRESAATKSARAPALEWIVASLGLVFIAVALILILAQVVGGDRQPPDLSVQVAERRATRNGWVVEVTVRNDGDETAAGVQVRGQAGEEVAEAELDYIPAHGRSKASLMFEQAPDDELKVGVAGWREP